MDTPVGNRTLDGPRPAQIAEREAVIALVNQVFRTARGWEPTVARDWAHVYAPSNLANVMVVTDQERVVASAGVWPSEVMVGMKRLRVGGINCVGTLPEYRRRGLASQLMSAAQERLRDLGCHMGLLGTDITGWYRRLGWEEAGHVRHYQVNRGNVGLLPRITSGLRTRFVEDTEAVQEGEESIAARLMHLHNQGQFGALRTAEEFRQRLVARKARRLFVAETEAGPFAYLLLRDNRVVEWAGPVEFVLALVRACFEALDNPHASTSQRNEEGDPVALYHLTIASPGAHHPLPARLDTLRIPYSTEYLGMIYMVDPQAILDAYGVSSMQVEAIDEGFLLHYKRKRHKFSRTELAKLFFGPERVSAFANDIFPLPFWQWYLEKV